MNHYDITIIGAGPAGSTLARILGKKYKVLLVDKRPLEKEPSILIKNATLLAPDAQNSLLYFGLTIPQEVLLLPEMFFVKSINFDNNMERTYKRHGVKVDRERYDRWLVSLCIDSCEQLFSTYYQGAKKVEEKYVLKLLQNNEEIEISTDIVVGADGANSMVKKEFIGELEHEPKKYISIQEWFPHNKNVSHFVAIFDKEISDYFSWIVPKDGGIILGSVIEEGKPVKKYHNLQKEKLKAYGYDLSEPLRQEDAFLRRPMSSKDICLGKGSVALIGEASGLISPTSAEGVSYAMLSGSELAKAILEDKENFLELYKNNTQYLKKYIDSKMKKYPLIFNPTLRKIVFKLGIGAVKESKI